MTPNGFEVLQVRETSMWKLLSTATLATMLALASAFAASDPNRIVTAVDPAAGTFSCQAKVGEPVYTYRTTAGTVFRVSGERVKLRYLWQKGSLSDVKVGETVTVQYHLRGSERIADRVAIYPKR
jgi:hypothetical protein